jgi:hypothetical protein
MRWVLLCWRGRQTCLCNFSSIVQARRTWAVSRVRVPSRRSLWYWRLPRRFGIWLIRYADELTDSAAPAPTDIASNCHFRGYCKSDCTLLRWVSLSGEAIHWVQWLRGRFLLNRGCDVSAIVCSRCRSKGSHYMRHRCKRGRLNCADAHCIWFRYRW